MSTVSNCIGCPKRCLLVEDDPTFAQQLKDAVQIMGLHWSIDVVQTGSEALEHIKKSNKKLDLVLVDLGLPDMHGNEVIRCAKKAYPDAPIMVVSVLTSERNLLEAIRLGANGYVIKNDTSLSISHGIQSVLEGSYPISPQLAQYLFRLAGSPKFSMTQSFPELTPKETSLLRLLSFGHTYGQVADTLDIKLSTVQFHIRNLYKKLEVHSQAQALAKANSIGLFDNDNGMGLSSGAVGTGMAVDAN